MVVYANQDGVIRDFSDISVVNVSNGVASLLQHLTSTEGKSQSFSRRNMEYPIGDETSEQLASRLNNSSIIISKSNTLIDMDQSV